MCIKGCLANMLTPRVNIGLTVGRSLEDLLQRALFAIENTPSKIIRDAGEETVYTIKALQEAYKKSSEQTIDQIDQVLKDRISQLTLAVKQIEERNYPELSKLITEGLQQPIASTRFATNYPYVRTCSPTSIVVSQAHDFVMEFLGNFPQAADAEFQPRLTLNGRLMATASLAVNQNTKLAFRVVTTEAFGQNDISVGALIIPYSTYVKFNKGHVRYQFEIQALPKTVGSIIIESTAPEVPPPVYEKKISPFFTLNSRKRHGGVDLQQTCSLSATPGKKIVHGSQNITWIKNKGKRSFSFQEVTEKTVSYLAKTYHHRAKDSHSGKLCFSIDFMEYNEPDPKMVPKQMPLELEWNGSKALPLPGKTWKVIFKPFDGSPAKEFASAYFDDPYIDIVVEGNNLRISTKEARKIKHFQSMRKLTISNIESDTAAELVKRITMEQQLFSLIASFGAGAAIGYYIARSRL